MARRTCALALVRFTPRPSALSTPGQIRPRPHPPPPHQAAAAAASALVDCNTTQVRLALTAAKDGSEMLVSWTTDTGAVPAPYAGVVRYGPTPAALTMTSAVADTRNYTLCNLPSPRLHAATMTGLVAGATYYYSISEPRCVATEPAQFTAPRAVGDAATAYPFTVFAYGDMGISNSQHTCDVRLTRTTRRPPAAPATATLANLTPNPTRAPRP